MRAYLKKCFDGEVSFIHIFWFWCFIPNVFIISFLIESLNYDIPYTEYNPILEYLYILLFIPLGLKLLIRNFGNSKFTIILPGIILFIYIIFFILLFLIPAFNIYLAFFYLIANEVPIEEVQESARFWSFNFCLIFELFYIFKGNRIFLRIRKFHAKKLEEFKDIHENSSK